MMTSGSVEILVYILLSFHGQLFLCVVFNISLSQRIDLSACVLFICDMCRFIIVRSVSRFCCCVAISVGVLIGVG